MSAAAAAAGGFTSWVLLERFVFRRDDDESFPDETSAPIRASATTSGRRLPHRLRSHRAAAHLPPLRAAAGAGISSQGD
ncbi:unnamed protein product [Urochloa humidicola]